MQVFGQNPMSPFGGGAFAPWVLKIQRLVSQCEPGKPVHKWQIFRELCELKSTLGLSDRALAVLNALLTFHPNTVLTSGSADIVVFPSNRQLALRTHGMAPSTLRRHIAALVAQGIVLRRDSANGKRFARKTPAGEIEQAFGFDLSPLVARAEEFAALAHSARERLRALATHRMKISLARRDIVKMIAAGLDAGLPGDWASYHRRYQTIVAAIPRTSSPRELELIVAELNELGHKVHALLDAAFPSTPPSSDATPLCDPEERSVTGDPAGGHETAAGERDVPLALVLEACPDIIDYVRGDIHTLRDLIAAATIVRPMLGISPSAWAEACEALGRETAAIVVAAILQRGVAISSPGGYLRNLTRRAQAGQFSVWRMVMAVHGARRGAGAGPAPSRLPSFSPGRKT
ncbi:replication initiation protein RepC [Ancylobacter dichloromethanicus]|uniref:Replication initiation protein n=1 Tax=Ancylobacter dichloromethanicus TaxID=518825 RepID=A0A9W6N1J9_9HYPH|nr:plasmid replication protein RepC [Ancylobacter dichloromethanicus]MBS7554834.1 replication initiation protein RepC [Ancylobacter dichloromethanicus]GLK74278.1 replication initiation protein [Ancylobacter dichloromethanicus]